MTYVQIARRTNESACLTEREALDARATLADPQGQEILRDCYADHQCPTGQLCVCGYAECSRRVVAAYYMNPRRPPYTTHMCLPKDAKNDLVRKCGTRSTDRCLSVDGGTPTPQSAVIALPTAPPVDAGWVMPRKDGGS